MARRYQRLEDLFRVTCRSCGSENVTLMVDVCDRCGNSVTACCDDCGVQFDGHAFVQVDE